MGPSPAESWPLCTVSGPPVSADARLAPASQLSPHVPLEEALSQQGRPGTMVTLQLLGPVRGERRWKEAPDQNPGLVSCNF